MKKKSVKIKKPSINKLWKECTELVKERDNNQCCICGQSGLLHVHHILPKERFKDLRFELNNLIVLCPKHHMFSRWSAHKNGIFFSEWLKQNRPNQYKYIQERVLVRLNNEHLNYLNNKDVSLINCSASSEDISMSSK